MNRTAFSNLQEHPNALTLLIATITACILVLNAYGLSVGITTVLPHLFYIPIILTSYFFPRRGILFACALSAIYFGMSGIVFHAGDIPSATGRIVIFIIVAAVVSFLALRLRESETKFRGVAERSSDIILLTDTAGKAIYVSPSVRKNLGYDPGDIIGHMPQKFIHPDDIGKIRESIPKSISGTLREAFTARFRRKEGSYAIIEFFGTPIIHEGQVTGIQVIGRDVSERTAAEQALRESEEKYRLLADYTYDWEYWIAPDETILYTTPSCERITGYTKEEFLADKDLIRKIVHPEDLHALDHHLHSSFAGEQPGSIDYRIIHRNGQVRWIGHVCQPIYNSRGMFTGRRASNRDITERHQAESALKDTSRRLADIIDFLPDPTFVIDREGKVLAWNRAIEELTGIPAVSILGKGDYAYSVWFYGDSRPVLIDMVLQEDIGAIRGTYPRFLQQGHVIRAEAVTKRPDGSTIHFWLTATPLFGQAGEVVGAIESLRDVTHQKSIARALKESNTYLDAVINTMADPLFIKDRDHRFVKVNDSFCSFTGHTRDELISKTDYDFFTRAEADLYRQKDEEVFRTGLENENEETLTDASGTTHTIVTKKTRYVDAANHQFIVGIIRDMTERKRLETALQQALKKLNMLSSITRHDILNQLMSLRSFLELTKGEITDPELLRFIDYQEKAAGAIQRQIEFTRMYDRLGVTSPQWYEITAVFRSALSQLPFDAIRVDIHTNGFTLYADPLIEKVFYNLLENTLRHGGAVTEVSLVAVEDSHGLAVTYCDNGRGVDPADKPFIFQKGFGKNTGLGLFLSQEILSITGITIREVGEPGKGACFEMHIPEGAYRITPA